MSSDPLDHAILAAHDAGDAHALIGGYSTAADHAESKGDTDAACFFLTYAYVYALEAGDPRASVLRARLIAYGREE